MADGATELHAALDSLYLCWRQGRVPLVVLGAGISVTASIPSMGDVYQFLLDACDKEPAVEPKYKEWLRALVAGTGSRSLAAMALGAFQRAHTRLPAKETNGIDRLALMDQIWSDLSRKFASKTLGAGRPRAAKSEPSEQTRALLPHACSSDTEVWHDVSWDGDREQTPWKATRAHHCVAKWLAADRAIVVSLNFDGLTRDAVAERLDVAGGGRAIIMSEPDELRQYHMASRQPGERLIRVVKVWGDVFHQTCSNPQCPESTRKVPVYDLTEPQNTTQDELRCVCGRDRQLRIFFTGYSEKERTTLELMSELLRFDASRIGAVVAIGVSGIWDRGLVDFMALVAQRLESEWVPQEAFRHRRSLICVDPKSPSFLAHEMRRRGLSVCHLVMGADAFADAFRVTAERPAPAVVAGPTLTSQNYAGEDDVGCVRHPLNEHAPHARLFPEHQGFVGPSSYELLVANSFLSPLSLLRQMGIKSRLGADGERRDHQHNRLRHSKGAAHIALYWCNHILSSEPSRVGSARMRGRLRNAAFVAALLHDIGHMPFTHLAEEVFDELHWTLLEWGVPFRHDERILVNVSSLMKDDVQRAIASVAQSLSMEQAELTSWIEDCIHGASGYVWLDAILNSPLDADKIDYVFLDCEQVGQSLHIDTKDHVRWIKGLVENAEVLDSGVIALSGQSGERARDFLEERQWLYRREYYKPRYRVIERLVRSVMVLWLLQRVRPDVRTPAMSDTSALKGMAARELLWRRLQEVNAYWSKRNRPAGEFELAVEMARDIRGVSAIDTKIAISKLPLDARASEWVGRCCHILEQIADEQVESTHPRLPDMQAHYGTTCSERLYVPHRHLPRVREHVRRFETERPFRAVVDIAVPPRMLSYPDRRRYEWRGNRVVGECFAVSHRDPDKWGTHTGKWVPMSLSAFADQDRERWATLMVISPMGDDPEVWQMLDRLRFTLEEDDIEVLDEHPKGGV